MKRSRSVAALCGLMLALSFCGQALAQADESIAAPQKIPSQKDMVFASGLICDTQHQAERFVSLLGDNIEQALLAVNTEAGQADACLIATFGFVPGQTVSIVQRNGAVVNVVEVVVMAVAATSGLHAIEPKTYYSVTATGQRIA